MHNIKEYYAKDRAAWRAWLVEHHDTERAVWLIFDKGKEATFKWGDIVQEALCFGWIDSKGGKVSDTQTKLYVARRKPNSGWSKINKAHVEKLVAAGLMTPSGQKVIDEAKQSGAWDLLNRSDNLELPERLAQKLSENSVAHQHFEAFTDSAKRILLEWIYSAKREETMDKRIDDTVVAAVENRRANEWRPKSD